ncbi:hypothetical protein [Couchioplanes caeruleus]|uniref:Uncharacterized protein n=2 Tax=Couchioplanes caeruleus TaxID=56438 RepID=A0A1K0FH73_9ACTN|nr:hypothetical protein [Couchioplanes caeruleus]OJF12080.1 hypothetical protein BG844_22580 [Couchioplanes caeruleus subsp. caeruleus]ROP28289.1 hypothetical protein EDD30_1031 [Couchioplanes caeruleus]
MLVEVLLDTPIHVHYGFLTLGQADEHHDSEDAYRGQVNGLCGASVPGVLHMKTGLHTGEVRVRIELHSDEPELGDRWQDIVEVSYTSWADDLMLTGFDSSEGPVDLPPGVYWARYCAYDFARGRDVDTAVDGAGPDDYLLQLWPATGQDRIVRQSGPAAAYWHEEGPEPAWTADDLATRVAELRQHRAEYEAAEAEDELDNMWDGQIPDDPRLQAAGWGAATLWQLDSALVEALADADDTVRRAVTVWALEQQLSGVGMRDEVGVAAALAAIREGKPLPNSWQLAQALPPLGMPPDIDQRAMARHYAIETLCNAAAGGDTLGTVCEVLVALVTGTGATPALGRVRAAFPELA